MLIHGAVIPVSFESSFPLADVAAAFEVLALQTRAPAHVLFLAAAHIATDHNQQSAQRRRADGHSGVLCRPLC